MTAGAKIFVLFVFSILGLSFWITTGVLYYEFSENWRQPQFEGALWFDLMTHYSHIFLFFPLFGTVALFAFFLPAAVFVDMYWRPAIRDENNIPWAKLRFFTGFIVTLVVSAGITFGLNMGEETALWQIKRDTLMERAKSPGQCAVPGSGGQCLRVTFPTALSNLRKVSQNREHLTDLTRNCLQDPLIEPLKGAERRRYCFVTTPYSDRPEVLASKLRDDKACCTALARFEADVRNTYLKSPDNRSMLDRIQIATLFLHVFFLLVILVISALLATRRKRIMSQYGDLAHRIDRGVLIGTLAMLFLPFMNHAYLLSTELIYGANDVAASGPGISFYRVPYALSIAFGVWGFLIMLFFIHREDKDAERMSKIMGTIASGVFVMKYDTMINYAVRYAGPGAGVQSVGSLIAIAVLLWLTLVLLQAFRRKNQKKTDHKVRYYRPIYHWDRQGAHGSRDGQRRRSS